MHCHPAGQMQGNECFNFEQPVQTRTTLASPEQCGPNGQISFSDGAKLQSDKRCGRARLVLAELAGRGPSYAPASVSTLNAAVMGEVLVFAANVLKTLPRHSFASSERNQPEPKRAESATAGQQKRPQFGPAAVPSCGSDPHGTL